MQSAFYRTVLPRLGLALCLAAAVVFFVSPGGNAASPVVELTAGKVSLQSAGPLAFGPDGILFVADSIGASVVAIDTGDRTRAGAPKLEVIGINEKIASLLGTAADQVMINDMEVNPISKNVYLSVSRGRGPDATPMILRVDAAGKISELSLNNIRHASATLADAPVATADPRRNPRLQTVTDLNFVDGKIMIAGLSNEEWASALRSIPYPFDKMDKSANVQIWHASHGRFETQAPVRTFIPYTIQGQSYILAAYTCTPLVKIATSELKPGSKVNGVTIADLGTGNQPLDMVPYTKGGHNYILIANSSRGTMKLQADNLENYKEITSPTTMDVGGVPFEPLPDLKGVVHATKLDESNAVILTSGASQDLRAIPLP
ncbi:MAG TPA: hypothetical protein VIG89_03440 [Candidatus Acidoferrales bacterium]